MVLCREWWAGRKETILELTACAKSIWHKGTLGHSRRPVYVAGIKGTKSRSVGCHHFSLLHATKSYI